MCSACPWEVAPFPSCFCHYFRPALPDRHVVCSLRCFRLVTVLPSSQAIRADVRGPVHNQRYNQKHRRQACTQAHVRAAMRMEDVPCDDNLSRVHAPAPSSAACVDSAPYDVMLVVDRSGSIGRSNWEEVVKYMKDRVRRTAFTDASGIRLGIVVYSTLSAVECPLQYDAGALLRCIEGIVYTGGWMNTLQGLLDAGAELQAHSDSSRIRAIEGVCRVGVGVEECVGGRLGRLLCCVEGGVMMWCVMWCCVWSQPHTQPQPQPQPQPPPPPQTHLQLQRRSQPQPQLSSSPSLSQLLAQRYSCPHRKP